MVRSDTSELTHFHTKIVGVTHRNSNGTDRQKLIRNCRLFEDLVLDHEEDNPHDPYAVRVLRENGQQLGYLNADLAAEVVSKSSKGYRFAVLIKDLTGGGKRHSLGVNLLIVEVAPGVSERRAKEYMKALIEEDPELAGAKIKKRGCFGKLVRLALMLLALFIAGTALLGFLVRQK